MVRFQRRSLIALVCVFMGIMGLGATAGAAEFAGGTGEPNDPYQIATPAQLLSIQRDGRKDRGLFTRHYILLNTIDLADTPVYGTVFRWPFTGSFDGKGYTIQNFGTEEIPAGGGLFSYIGSGGEVKNLGIVTAYVQMSGVLAGMNEGAVRNCYCTGATVSNAKGGLIGVNGWGAVVTDCHSEAEVSGPNSVGGLIGGNSGIVSRCYSRGKVSGLRAVGGLIGSSGGIGEVSSCYSTSEVSGINSVGGLIGSSGVVVSDCYSTGAVTGTGDDTGGLAGYSWGAIFSCYSTSPVTGRRYVGGLVGTNAGYNYRPEFKAGRISGCYADANVVSEGPYAGGLVGYNWVGTIESCYSTGVVTAPDYLGGLVGYSDDESGIATSYSVVRPTVPGDSLYAGGLVGDGDADHCYFLAPADGGGPDNGIGAPLTDAEMRQQASFVGWDFSEPGEDAPAGLWFMPEDAYPVLLWQAETTNLKAEAAVPDDG